MFAVVTGGGSGIGRATAVRLGRAGYVCVLVGRREEPLCETADLIAQEGGRGVVVPADVTAEDARGAVMTAVDQDAGVLAALVNNAGGSYIAPLFAQDPGRWRENFALNIDAAAFLSFLSDAPDEGDRGRRDREYRLGLRNRCTEQRVL